MKFVVVIVLTVLSFVSSQRSDVFFGGGRGDSGAYSIDDSRAYSGDDGRYYPDDSGRYIPDGTGQYTGDYERYRHQEGPFGGAGGGGGGAGGSGGGGSPFGGRYKPDNSGLYTGDYERYRHQEGPSGPGGNNVGGFGPGSGKTGIGSGLKPVGFKDVVGLRPSGLRPGLTGTNFGTVKPKTPLNVQPAFSKKPINPSPLKPQYTTPSTKGNVATGVYDIKHYDIINKVEDVSPQGYHFLYETENKIFGEETARLENVGQKDEAIKGIGYYEYTGPDNKVYRVDYTADENGFIPQAEHLPTPPPIPEYILRALEYQKSIGKL